jgi:hypothetical protein
MSTAFLDEVVATAKKVRQNVNVSFTLGSAPRLPHEDINLYGADAGQDYAQTVFEALKAAIKEAAECKQGKLTIRIPSGGESARRSIEKTIADLLAGFDVSTTNTRLSVSWEKHLTGAG